MPGSRTLKKLKSQRRPTNNLEAYDLYLKANSISREAIFSNQIGQNLLQAIHLLDEAVARDPKFFEAYCDLAMLNDELYFIGIRPYCATARDRGKSCRSSC